MTHCVIYGAGMKTEDREKVFCQKYYGTKVNRVINQHLFVNANYFLKQTVN